MKKVIIIAFLFAFIEGLGTSITPCKCTQLLSQGDCTNSPLGCIWNSTKKDCAEYIETITPTFSYAQYCDNFSEKQCSQIIGCAWVNGKCTFFTGCTPFVKTQNIDCQAISIKCITDGTHCVEVTTCNSFVKETSCFKNQSDHYCYWDTVNKICVDANTCDRLPSILTTDSLCRHQISTCTTTGKGCIQSATNCSDQNTEISCFWNQDQTQACYWTGTTCVEFKCENAPKTLTTDEACKKFIPNGPCTTQQGGGCTTRSTCQAVKIEAACVKDSKGLICFWNGTACVDKTCANAARTLKSNSECQEYLSTCITNGKGCVTNTTCSSAFLQIACVINAAGMPCIWDVYCKEKTCANAPTKHNSYALCTSFLPKCTVNASSNGCTNRTCENAPTSLISNTDCETYLPNSKCIAKTEGGCVTNTICEAITVQRACITDAKGKICFWDPSGSGSCKDKTCVNAPNTYTDDAACSSYLKTCTVASGGSGCVNRTCENLLTSALCTIDLNNKPCIYKGLCYMKQCALAPSSFNTHLDCNGYLGSCTLSNTGSGCVPIPLVCSVISKLEACYLKKVINPTTGVITYAKCGWNGQQCIDLECSTLGLTSKTTAQCEELNPGHYCVSANPVNGVVVGCIDLPTTCAQRKTKDNCEVAKSGIPNCIWNSKLPIPICVYKSCETASLAGTTGILKIFTNINCQAYLNTCIANNKANGCISKPNDCSSLTSSANCGDGSKKIGDCYWNGTCVDKICVNISGVSHIQCNTKSNLCTVKADGKGCTNLEETCSAYITSNQCYLNSSNRLCKWTGTLCRNANCNDAPDNNIYDSDSKCFNWPTVEETCTVLYKIGGKGCVARLPNCQDYTSQTQCVRTLTASIDDCQWYSSASLCLDRAFFSTKACDKLNGTQMLCESYKVGCTNNVKAVETDACTFDCSKKVGTDHSLNFEICQQFDSSCSVNNNGSACITKKSTCEEYTGISECFQVSSISFCIRKSEACQSVLVAEDCAQVTGTGLTHQTCQTYSLLCTSNFAQTACQEYKYKCADLGQANCSRASVDGLCVWKSTQHSCIKPSTIATDCAFVTGFTVGTMTDAGCAAYLIGCNANANGSGCQEAKATCGDYTAKGSGACANATTDGKCYWYNPGGGVTATCIKISITDCAKVTSGVSTFAHCQAYNTGCSINRAGNACLQLQETCGGYSSAIAGCAQTSDTQLCISNSADNQCVTASTATTCETVYLGYGNYNDANCSKFKSWCTVNSTNNGCVSKTCINYKGIKSHTNCNNWINICTVNATATECTTMPAQCNEVGQTSFNCLRAAEGECVVSGSVCVKKTCDTTAASASFDDDTKCSTYLSSCTVARTGGCQARTACASYKSSLQCKISSSGGKCFWNPTALTCVDLSCANVEQTTSFDSHSECYGVDSTLKCTVRAANGASVAGCMARTACASYTIQDQCVTNSTGGVCEWNTNLTTPACADKSCATAATGSYTTHLGCNGYLNTCTAAVVVTSGVNTLAGCQALAACATYTMSEQCVVDATGVACGWNGTVCANKSCATAPATADYSTDTQCRAYFTGCTVAASGQGCIAVAACESYIIQEQCISNYIGALCYWIKNTNLCITRQCENAPLDTTDCNAYLEGCTSDTVKCKTKICEDYTLTSDAECSAVVAICTSNGINCVTRGTCAQATTATACVTQSNGAQCQWIVVDGSAAAYCTIKSCDTASRVIITESACQQYFPGCTVKKGGGCILKDICTSADVEAACTTDINGTECQWDQTSNACRNKFCQKYGGSTHQVCQEIDQSCTIGANGFCADITSCANTKVRQACIQGTDGPCLWIEGYENSNGTKGACFQYTSCQSLNWTTNKQCNLISDKCTTNGTNCVGITLCSETNTNGGCVNGYDGACIQYVDALGSTNPPKCQAFTSCSDAFYATHAACQTASSKCTTNGTTGCIALGACSTYTQAGCFFNNQGPEYKSGDLISTGVCIWDTTINACRDQNCSDLKGADSAACSNQLSACISDGTKCFSQTVCSIYDQAKCLLGIDGFCFWDAANSVCRKKVCEDVKETTTQICSAQFSGCISDGQKCVPKANCSSYNTKTSCNSGGINGLCIFTASSITSQKGTCKLMTSCVDANNDQTACKAAKDRCSWTATNLTGRKCTPHTCETYYSTNGVCRNFFNWGKTRQQVCTIQNNICIASDPTTLSQTDCYSASGYTYTWSSYSERCGLCKNPVYVNNNNKNNTNNNTTKNGLIFPLWAFLLEYLFF